MTIADLKTNRIVHLYLAAFGLLLALIAAIETGLLFAYRQRPELVAYGVAAYFASLWIFYRMHRWARMLAVRIHQAEARAKLHESLDNAFENVLGRTRERYSRERGGQIIDRRRAA